MKKNIFKYIFLTIFLIPNNLIFSSIKINSTKEIANQIKENIKQSLFFENLKITDDGNIITTGQLSSERLEKYIKEFNIKSIINLRGEKTHKEWYKNELEICKKLNVAHYNIKESLFDYLKQEELLKLVKIIENSSKPLMIHCRQGIDRTGEIYGILNYLLYKNIFVKIIQKNLEKSIDEFISIATKRLSLKNGHITLLYPKKKKFVKKLGKFYLNILMKNINILTPKNINQILNFKLDENLINQFYEELKNEQK